MMRLRRLLRPIRLVQYLSCRMSAFVHGHLAERSFRNIRRSQRRRCWCGGELLPFKWHASYGVCAECGCYVNRRPPLLEELERLYSFDLYWHTRQQLKGHPTIEQRTENDLRDGRVDFWLSLIQRYGPPSGRVIEVGCGHAVLLCELRKRGYDCIGVEINDEVSDWVRRNTGLEIVTGAFPQVELPECDMFLALDVLEHVHDPVAFLQKANDLLRPGGIAILQQPTIRPEQGDKLDPPFGVDFERVFDDVEHLWIFTSASLRRLAGLTQFHMRDDTSRWHQCHEIVVLGKKMAADE